MTNAGSSFDGSGVSPMIGAGDPRDSFFALFFARFFSCRLQLFKPKGFEAASALCRARCRRRRSPVALGIGFARYSNGAGEVGKAGELYERCWGHHFVRLPCQTYKIMINLGSLLIFSKKLGLNPLICRDIAGATEQSSRRRRTHHPGRPQPPDIPTKLAISMYHSKTRFKVDLFL
ncbi:hypothetical protein SISNIDRAFT_118383 [Sistotremastrum niveocremeum HHB9708]|uniref:Uncharacterized protein n=1 Tax=Sistotremastrum niveocremeum HHB9708 TaxID=1314777 RepID=A0A164TPW8_9AGAM|nr:hypothetical protein SISNIDRAFT_118383 [Sistotremastrum niveocremeum HHB9708]